MKKTFYLIPIGMLLISTSVIAQKANVDSLKLVAQIGQDQLALGKLQNQVQQKTINKQNATIDAQNSASNNANAAEKLNADPTNKALANNASNSASDAKSDARKSRKDSVKLDDLNKNIMQLKSKIAEEQYKLSVYSPTPAFVPGVIPTPVKPDSTMHP
jgi:hypothetical protein